MPPIAPTHCISHELREKQKQYPLMNNWERLLQSYRLPFPHSQKAIQTQQKNVPRWEFSLSLKTQRAKYWWVAALAASIERHSIVC